jgi:hypothetical protein
MPFYEAALTATEQMKKEEALPKITGIPQAGFKASGSLTNTAVLCFVLGWQGGTVFQVAEALRCDTDDILEADYDGMGILCRRAQTVRGGNYAECKYHLHECVHHLKLDYNGHMHPAWLQAAIRFINYLQGC